MKKEKSKRSNVSREKRARKLKGTLKYDERSAKQNKKRHNFKGENLAKSNARRKYKELQKTD